MTASWAPAQTATVFGGTGLSRAARRPSAAGGRVCGSDRRAPSRARSIAVCLLEQNDEWAVQRARYMTLETIAPLSEDPIFKLPAVAA